MSIARTRHIEEVEVYSTSLLKAYLQLVKMRLSTMVVFTALAAYVINAGTSAHMVTLLLLGVGGFAITAASNAINQILEREYDGMMTRTSTRPLVTGRLSTSHAVMFAGFMCMLGITLLSMINPLSAFFGMLSFVLYGFVYTPLKRYSSVAVTIGALAGAMPLLIGSVAWSGGVTFLALCLFGIQFAWQFPHFWAIGFLGYRDYEKADFAFIPNDGDTPCRSIAVSGLVYCAFLMLLTLGMFYLNMLSMLTFVVIMVANVIFAKYAFQFLRKFDLSTAKRLMFASLIYIPFVMISLLIQNLFV